MATSRRAQLEAEIARLSRERDALKVEITELRKSLYAYKNQLEKVGTQVAQLRAEARSLRWSNGPRHKFLGLCSHHSTCGTL